VLKQAQVQAVTEQLGASVTRNEALTNELQTLRQALFTAKAEAERLQSALDTRAGIHSVASEQLSALLAQKAALVQEHAAAIAASESALAAARSQYSEVCVRVHELEQANAKLRESSEELKSLHDATVSRMQRDLDRTAADHTRSSQTTSDLIVQLARLTAEAQTSAKAYVSSKSLLDAAQARYDELERQFNQLRATVAATESQSVRLRVDHERTTHTASELLVQLSRLTAENRALTARNTELSALVSNLEEMIRSPRVTVSDEELARLRGELDSAVDQIRSMQLGLEKAHGKLRSVQEMYETDHLIPYLRTHGFAPVKITELCRSFWELHTMGFASVAVKAALIAHPDNNDRRVTTCLEYRG